MSTIPTDRQRMLHIELDLPVAVQDEFYAVQRERLASHLPMQTLPDYLVGVLSQDASDSHERRLQRMQQRIIHYRWSAYTRQRR